MRHHLSTKDIRGYMVVWIKEELMPAIERACMEWLDNDVMPHVHWEAVKMGFQSDVMYKPTGPRQPSQPPPPHLMERALKRGRSGSGMASGSGSGSADGHGGGSGMKVEPESHMDTKKQRFMPPSSKAPSEIMEPMSEPQIFKPPEPMAEAQDVKPFEPLRHTAMAVKEEEEEDKEDDADKEDKEDDADKEEEDLETMRQEEADKVREAEEEEEDNTMDQDGHEGRDDHGGNDDQEPEHGELMSEEAFLQAQVECFALARNDVKDCLKRRIKNVYPPAFSSRSDATGLE